MIRLTEADDAIHHYCDASGEEALASQWVKGEYGPGVLFITWNFLFYVPDKNIVHMPSPSRSMSSRF